MKATPTQSRSQLIIVNLTLGLLVLLWMIPVIGLLVSSFRDRLTIQTSGWWSIFPHKEWQQVAELNPKDLGLDANAVMNIEGVDATFEELRLGVETPDGKRLQWIGNKRLGTILIQENNWVGFNLKPTFENYGQVMQGKDFEYKKPDGTVEVIQGDDFWGALFNSMAVSFPATIIPILIAAFAAYGFAWMSFPGRKLMFIMIVGLTVVPLQIALVPVLRDFSRLGLNGTYLAMWLAHTGFGLPLATYLLFNYIATLPRETLESAFIDGASHFTN